ncbi:tyrosine-type recombinase/integrase [Spirillospora sp. CA-128828]|uniref:tyrosine-type recombinase/integrase n=1 Tax=Spirillospora sp. CA-128828 TaxID=3240033 RepID=UPI003D90250F
MTDPQRPKRKPRKRRNRDARAYRRRSDGKWVAVAYLPNGKRRPCYGDTAEEAEDKRKQLYRELEENQPITVGRTDTLGQFLTGPWLKVILPQRVEAGRLAQSTLDSYMDMAERHIVPELGKVKLVELSTLHVQAWMLTLSQKKSGRARRKLRPGEDKLPEPERLSARTIAYCHAILRKALNDAMKAKLISGNVCADVEPPRVEKKEARALTKDEARKLLAAAADHRLSAYWLVVLALGLRRGEGLGLHWMDFDLEAGTVRLRLSVQRLRGERNPETGKHRGKLVAKGLKTDASKATIKLPAYVVEAVKLHRKQQSAERLAARVWANDDLVFTTTIGTALEPRNVNRMWHELCDKAGVERCRIHDLRHACGSFLFADGVDLKVIQGVLRHTRLATTSEVYVHLLDEVRDKAADTMHGLLVDLTRRDDETG